MYLSVCPTQRQQRPRPAEDQKPERVQRRHRGDTQVGPETQSTTSHVCCFQVACWKLIILPLTSRERPPRCFGGWNSLPHHHHLRCVLCLETKAWKTRWMKLLMYPHQNSMNKRYICINKLWQLPVAAGAFYFVGFANQFQLTVWFNATKRVSNTHYYSAVQYLTFIPTV